MADNLERVLIDLEHTSLSDTAVPAAEVLPFWQRSGSLSRRRKVSVPELGGTMTTVQETAIDSREFTEPHPPHQNIGLT